MAEVREGKDAKATREVRVNVSNGAAAIIDINIPYAVEVQLTGSSALLFHRWNAEGVDEKARAAKGSKAKKSDNIEEYVWRNEQGLLCIPGEYVRQSMIHAAKFKQDPRSPRKSAMDLVKAGVVSLTDLASVGVKEWDFVDRRRVMIQRNGINRERPGLRAGWVARFELLVNLPEYLSPDFVQDLLVSAGRLIGIGDFRPTYGRFQVTSFQRREQG